MEPKKKMNTARRVEELIRGAVEQAGYQLWDVDFFKEGADHTLLVTIERPGRGEPIGLEDCEAVTRLIDPILDGADPIEESYYLEVSSAGLERELKRPEHFKAFLGEKIKVRLFAPQDGSKEFRGVLKACGDGKLVLETEGAEREFETEKIAKAVADDLDPQNEEK